MVTEESIVIIPAILVLCYYTCLKLVQQLRSTGVATKIPGPAIDLEAQDLTDVLDASDKHL